VIAIHPRRFAGAAALALVAAGVLAGCGGSDSSSTSTTTTTAAAGLAGQQGDPNGNDTQMAAVQKCLSSAGISMPTPPGGGQPGQGGGQPTGAPSGMPSGAPNGTPPSGMPSGGAGGPGGGPFSDAKVVAALKACGIAVPTGGPGQGGAAATASTTS
jgi:hypothetical protein